MTSGRRLLPLPRLAAAVVLAAAAAVLPASLAPASAAPTPRTLTWSATLDGRDIGSASANRPIPLVPTAGSVLALQLENTGGTPIIVSGVVVEGRVIGLSFFHLSTRMNVVLPAHRSTRRVVPLERFDLADLEDQANGLIPARVQLLGPEHQVLASQSFVADVRGRTLSVYGVFGLIVAAMTCALAAGLLFALWRGRLVENRWQRGMQFLPVGAGAGLTGTFTLSALRLLAPGAGVWLPLVLACCATAFVLGYLTPAGADAGSGDGWAQRRAGHRAAPGAALAAGGAAAFAADHAVDDPDDIGTPPGEAPDGVVDLRTTDEAADWPDRDSPGWPHHTDGQ